MIFLLKFELLTIIISIITLLVSFSANFINLIIERKENGKKLEENKYKYIIRVTNKHIKDLGKEIFKNSGHIIEHIKELHYQIAEGTTELSLLLAHSIEEAFVGIVKAVKNAFSFIVNNLTKLPDLIVETFSRMIYLVLIIGLIWTIYFMYDGFNNPEMLDEANSKASLIVSSATLFSIMVAYHGFVKKE